MSTMLDTYDMQMVDYQTDLDIQMHPSSSDQWFQDGAKMEEDMEAELYSNLKTDGSSPMHGHDKDDVTIEVDMDDHQHAEYDMVDDEEIQDSAPDILDVEVYDASVAHSPAMLAFEPELPVDPTFHSATEPQLTTDTSALGKDSLAVPDFQRLDSQETPAFVASLHKGSDLPPQAEAHVIVPLYTAEVDLPRRSDPLFAGVHEQQPADNSSEEHALAPETTVPHPFDRTDLNTVQEVSDHQELVDNSQPSVSAAHDDDPSAAEETNDAEAPGAHAETASSGDPHEISDGVYIDPPPPVLLSIGSDDVTHHLSLFNEFTEWSLLSAERAADNPAVHLVLLQHLPTLYYEPISTVFEALRQEDIIQTILNASEAELILDIIDLGLTISEDNVYAREVTLHDLNVLHDTSGIGGPLRARLYAPSIRFIVRYQQLQEHVSQLHLEQPPLALVQEALEHSHEELPNSEERSVNRDRIDETAISADIVSGPSDLTVATLAGDRISDLPAADVLQVNHDQQPGDKEEHPEDGDGEDDQYGVDEAQQIGKELRDEEGQGEAEGDDTSNGQQNEHHSAPQDQPQIFNADHTEDQYPKNTNSTIDDQSTSDADHQDANSASNDPESAVIGLDALEVQDDENSYGDEVDEDYSSENTIDEPTLVPEVGQEHVSEEQDELRSVHDVGDEYDEIEVIEGVAETGGASEEILSSEDAEVDGHNDNSNVGAETTGESYEHELSPDHNEDLLSELQSQHPGDLETALEDDVDAISSNNPYNQVEQHGIEEFHEDLPELPTEPISFDDENWEEELDGEGEPDTTWDEDENEKALSTSNQSSATLSSRASKRSFDELESGGEGYDEEEGQWDPPSSPDPKRSRTE